MKIFPLLAATFLALSAPAFAEGDAKKGEKVFKKCKACHMVGDKAKNRVGPPLNGIVGSPSAQVQGFKYSKAMQKADVTWDDKTLDTFLKKPRTFIKGTKMSFAGLKKDKDRENVIAYLKQF